jgi:hypothetical protein
MKSILDFMYEGRIAVQPKNSVEVFNAAKKFQVKELEDHVMNNMEKYMTVDNFIGFYVATKDGIWKKKKTDVLKFMIE